METLTQLTLILFIMTLGLVIVAAWAPRKFWVKVCAIILGVFVTVVGYIGFSDLLSRPKPVALELMQRSVKSVIVLSAKIVEGKGIYLWLQLPKVDEPRYYKIPWKPGMEKIAAELEKALREGRKGGGKVGMNLPFEPSLDRRERLFYPMPQPAPPPKDAAPSGAPHIFERPQREH